MELVEIHERSEKEKWQSLFINDPMVKTQYETQIGDGVFDDSIVRFLVAKENDEEIGYIRINNKSKFFEKDNLDYEIWNAADAYVKPEHRSKGILKKMLIDVIANHQVKMTCLDGELFLRNKDYYSKLGFTKITKGKGGLYWLHHQDISDLIV